MNDQTITLTKVYNPLNRSDQDTIQWQYQHGSTVADLLDNTGNVITQREGHHLAVSVNGQMIPADKYAETTLLPGQCVTLVPVLSGGGGGGKDIIRMVGLVIIAVVAAVLQQYWAESILFATAINSTTLAGIIAGIGSGLVMVGGSMLLNAAIGRGNINSPALNGYGSIDQSNSYSWNPQNTQQQGISIPVYYGTCKISGNIIGVYRENIGSQQYINALISLGMGPISPPTNIKINGQPYENYTGITLNTRLGYLNQDVILGFDDTRIEYPQGTKVIYGTPVTYTTIGNDFDGLTITVGFPNGLYYYSDTGALAAVAVKFSIEIKKQGDIDWTHIATSPGTIRVSDGGYWSAGFWNSFDDYSNYSAIWSEIANGGTDPNSHYEGERYTSFTLWRWIGEPIRIVDAINPYVTASAAQTSALTLVHSSSLLPAGRYDIRITRLTTDYTDTRHGDDFYLLSVQELLQDNFTYPGTALVGLRALATDQLSGSFSFECKTAGKLCRVYDGTTWSVTTTSNPAWVCFDILTQPVFDNDLNVLEYAAYNPADMDITRWLEWAEYCDDLVPDGNGGTEPRLTFNGSFDSNQSMWDAALNVAKIGRGTPYWRGTTITVAIDKPSSPVALISVGNIGLDSFEETFLSMENRAGSIEADFLNLEKDLDRDKFTVINPDAPAEWGSASLPLQGVIKPSEIWRHCRYYLATTQQLTRIVSVQMDIDAIAFTIGDVINVQHDVPMWGDGGRIVSATSNSVTVDRVVTVVVGKSYSIMIRLLDGTIVERAITNAVGDHAVLTVSSAFTATPEQFDVYAFGEVNTSIKPMRVVSIDPAGDLKRKITLTDYNESVYNTDLMLPVVPTVNYSGLTLPPVSGLRLSERMVKKQGGLVVTLLDIAWNLITDSAVKAVEVFINNQSIGLFASSMTGTSVEVRDSETVFVAVRSIGWNGTKQDLAVATRGSLYIIGKTARPADVTGLTATTTTSGALRLDWLPVSDIDIDYYEVVVGSAWNNSVLVAKAYTSTLTLPAAISGTYMVKAVDTSGLKSINAASVVVVMPTDSYRTQQTLTESTSYPGLKTGCNVVSGKLDLDLAGQWDGTQAVGYYYASSIIDLGSVQPARCLCMLDFLSIDTQTTWDDVVNLDAVPNIDDIGVVGNAEGCELQPQIATSQDGTNWSAWQPFAVGDYPARAFKFRLKLTSTIATAYPSVSALQYRLLLPYRSQIMPDVILPTTATTIALTPPFVNKPQVKANIQNAQSGDTVVITGVTVGQFTIQVLNGGSGVARTVDIEATGT